MQQSGKLHDMDILRNLESTFILWIQIDIYFLASTKYLMELMLFNSKSRSTCTDFCEEPHFFHGIL